MGIRDSRTKIIIVHLAINYEEGICPCKASPSTIQKMGKINQMSIFENLSKCLLFFRNTVTNWFILNFCKRRCDAVIFYNRKLKFIKNYSIIIETLKSIMGETFLFILMCFKNPDIPKESKILTSLLRYSLWKTRTSPNLFISKDSISMCFKL